MQKKTLSALLFTAISLAAYSQDTIVKQDTIKQETPAKWKSTYEKTSIGLGYGLDYGGFGANILYYPQKSIGVFAGLGYNGNGFGYNAGAKLRLINEKRPPKLSPFLMGMYGYNTRINVKDASQYNKIFYGPSIGIGLDYKSNPKSAGYWSFALLVPIRGSKVDDYLDDLEKNTGFKEDLWPINFSIGYRFIARDL